MKKIVLTVALILAFPLNYGFAQTMMGGQEGAKGPVQEMKGQKGMMTPE